MLKKLLLLSFVLGLSYCTLWVGGYSHIEQIEDDEHVGKTLLIYPSAGHFVLNESWYFGKRTGDSFFTSRRMKHDLDNPPVLYKVVGKYRKVNHGTKRIFVSSESNRYLLAPSKRKADKRLFFFSLPLCEEQTDLFDQETNIKIDFVCD